MIEIKYDSPRWRCNLKCNGKSEKMVCRADSKQYYKEYSQPEFFIMEDGGVVFRFFDKDTGFKLQGGNDGPFKKGVKYRFSRGDEYFSVSFDWLYGGKAYSCDSGWMSFDYSVLPGVTYTVDFEFDLSAPDGSTMEIRNGVFSVYDKSNPVNTIPGLE